MLIFKKEFSLFVILLLISVSTIGQTYVEFPDSNVVWRQTDYWNNQTSLICRDYQLFIVGDTTINSIAYSNIYWSGTWGPNGWCNYQVFSTGTPIVGLREDSTKHIYLFDYNSSMEYLLYDFNLTLGDTLPNALPWNQWQGGTIITISQLDSVQIGASYRKRYWCSTAFSSSCSPCANYMSIIEGIGSEYGLFADLSPNWPEKNYSLICLSQNGQTIYPFGQTCNLVPVGIDENISVDKNIKIFPNPASIVLNIQTSVSGQLDIVLTDLYGKDVLIIKNLNNSAPNQFHIDHLNNGLYIMKLFNGDSLYSSRKIAIAK